jgi:hypothetical protein
MITLFDFRPSQYQSESVSGRGAQILRARRRLGNWSLQFERL